MLENPNRRARRTHARTAALLPLLVAACLGSAAPSHAAARNTLRYIQPVVSRGHATTYDVCLYSTAEFPMRDEVVTLAIGGQAFINSRYLQGGDLHTIIFSLTQSQYLSLHNGDPIAVYYGQGDASLSTAQWSFGTLRGVPAPPATKRSVSASAQTTTHRGTK